ncbi:MAG: hypothetical protein EPN85_01870 [Bacteroidetes bacterium]|nr:MAG: hypothetical protein EPN85_01870 [Bacteroidota bacterium]
MSIGYKMKRIINLATFFSLFQLIGYGQYNLDSILGRKHSVNVSKNDILGTWSCFNSVYDDPLLSHDAAPPYPFQAANTVIFDGDSLFELNFPCELVNRGKYIVQNDSLISSFLICLLDLTDDTLTLYTGNAGGEYTLRQYVRGMTTDAVNVWGKTDALIFNLLKQKSINIDCLIGEWVLVKEYDSGYDGHGIVKISYPFSLPSLMNINNENISKKMIGNRQLLIPINYGKKRPFYIQSFSESNTVLVLSPGKWWKDANERIEYKLK